jgi:hypothetical protein
MNASNNAPGPKRKVPPGNPELFKGPAAEGGPMGPKNKTTKKGKN